MSLPSEIWARIAELVAPQASDDGHTFRHKVLGLTRLCSTCRHVNEGVRDVRKKARKVMTMKRVRELMAAIVRGVNVNARFMALGLCAPISYHVQPLFYYDGPSGRRFGTAPELGLCMHFMNNEHLVKVVIEAEATEETFLWHETLANTEHVSVIVANRDFKFTKSVEHLRLLRLNPATFDAITEHIIVTDVICSNIPKVFDCFECVFEAMPLQNTALWERYCVDKPKAGQGLLYDMGDF